MFYGNVSGGNRSDMKKKFKIDGMHCTSCAMTIDMDLEDLEGVKSARTNYAKRECEVEFDLEKINEKIILQTIQKSGYRAEVMVKTE